MLGRSPARGCTEERGNSGNTNEDDGRGRVFATTPTALREFRARAKWRRRQHRATSRDAPTRRTIEEFRRDSVHTRRDEGARQATTRRHVASPVAGTEFQVPKEVGTLLTELIARVRSMEERLTDHKRQAASSTRMADNRSGQNVHFEDTFSIPDECEVWAKPSLPPQSAGPAEQAGLNPAWVGGDRQNPARSSSWPNYTAPGMSANLSRSGLYHSRDIGQILRKWQIPSQARRARV